MKYLAVTFGLCCLMMSTLALDAFAQDNIAARRLAAQKTDEIKSLVQRLQHTNTDINQNAKDLYEVDQRASILAAQLEATIAQIRAQISRLDESIQGLQPDITQLETEKEHVLSDLRNNQWCNQCGHSKTEIEKTGENFEAHLNRVGGKAYGPTPQAVNEKAQYYDRIISAKRDQLSNAVALRGRLATVERQTISGAQQNLSANQRARIALLNRARELEMNKDGLVADIYRAVSMYNIAIDTERLFIAAKRETERDNENRAMERFDRRLQDIVRMYDEEYDKSPSDGNVIGALRIQMGIVSGLMKQATLNATRNIAAYRRTITEYNERVAAEDMAINGWLLTVTDASDAIFTLPRHNPLAVIIPKAGLTLSFPPDIFASRVEFKLSPQSVALKVNLIKWLAGKLTVSSVFETGEQSITVSLEALKTSVGVQYTSYRGQSGYFPVVKDLNADFLEQFGGRVKPPPKFEDPTEPRIIP